MSQITTHVLDTSKGKPAELVSIKLEKKVNDDWEFITEGITNSDGRIPEFLPNDKKLEVGIYRMIFASGDYFHLQGIVGFYPEIPIIFELRDQDHYHVPLLLNPFGYSTYRGS